MTAAGAAGATNSVGDARPRGSLRTRERTRRTAWPALLLASGCAWSNPANRPVWNSFEANVVPSGDAAFYATLPLTVPIGFGAILLDTLIVHPIRVIDDAAGDAADGWKGLQWRAHYFTELGLLPARVVGTPFVFLGSFLGRCLFDIPPHGRTIPEKTDEAPADPLAQARARAAYLDFFAAVATGGEVELASPDARPTWDDELAQAFDAALRQGNAAGRAALYRAGRRLAMPPMVAEPWLGLRDPDPVVRYLELQGWPRSAELPPALRDNLRTDPCESVRLLAIERFR